MNMILREVSLRPHPLSLERIVTHIIVESDDDAVVVPTMPRSAYERVFMRFSSSIGGHAEIVGESAKSWIARHGNIEQWTPPVLGAHINHPEEVPPPYPADLEAIAANHISTRLLIP